MPQMAVIARGVMAEAAARGLEVVRCYSGALMTSLQMSGFSITLFKLCGGNGVPEVSKKNLPRVGADLAIHEQKYRN